MVNRARGAPAFAAATPAAGSSQWTQAARGGVGSGRADRCGGTTRVAMLPSSVSRWVTRMVVARGKRTIARKVG